MFPKDTIISEESQDLLRRLIEFNPEKRLSWKEFFNHKLFDNANQSTITSDPKLLNYKLSICYTHNCDKVEEQFQKNKEADNPTTQLQCDLNNSIIPQESQQFSYIKSDTPENPKVMNNEYENDVKKVQNRFRHKQSIILFI